MGDAAPVCEHCGASLLADTFFCGSCGKPVVNPPRSAARKHTVLGGLPAMSITSPAPALRGDAATSPAPALRGDAATSPAPALRGDASVPQPTPQPVVPERERTTDVGISEPPAGAMGRTMLGLGKPAAVGEARPPAAQQAAFGKTMLGMPNLSGLDAAKVPAQKPTGGAVPHTRTLLGGPESQAIAAAVAAADRQATPARSADTSRTMLGLDADAQPVTDKRDSPTPAKARDSSVGSNGARASTERGSRPSGERGSRGSRASDITLRRGPSYAVYALVALALGAAIVFGYLSLRQRAPNVQVRVVSDGASESMLFEVPGSPEGAKLRFGGQEKPVQAGRASFALGGDSLRVGKNAVLFDLVKADGDVESGRVTLSVDYRVTLDTAPLRAGKPAVDVVVSAVPGSKVFLDGQPLALDAQGRAVRSDALEAGSASGRIEHVVKYRVQPPAGEATVGELRTTIPVTSMQIDRPGMLVVTDKDAVEIAGAVDKDARVTIDGKQVPVVGDRFLYKYALPRVGDFLPRVVAMADGKAPRSSAIMVQRVDNLAKAAEGFKPEAGLSYAKIAQNPAIYRGQRVAFEGRVYNVNVEAGRSVLQVLVRECPRGDRCPLWVSYGSATEYTVDSWVRVLGILQGVQQFRAESDEVRTVPKVDAVFLLPAK